MQTVKIKKPLRAIAKAEVRLPEGIEITLTDQWESAPFGHAPQRVILVEGKPYRVTDEELQQALQ